MQVDSIDRMVGDLLNRIDKLGGKIDDLQQSIIDGHDEHPFYEEEAHDYSKLSMIALSLLICLLVCEIVRLRGTRKFCGRHKEDKVSLAITRVL